MAMHFATSAAAVLLKKFNDSIDQDEPKGRINTWVKHVQDGVTYYTHSAPQWAEKAYFKAATNPERLTFNIINPKGKTVDVEVYAYYHGHLIETFLRHFSTSFASSLATAQAQSPDQLMSPKKR